MYYLNNVTGRGCPSSSRRNEKKKNTTGRAVPSLSCRNESNDTRRRGYAPPSLSCQKRNLNTTGRAGALPIVLKWQERDEEGHIPPRRVKKETKTRRGGHQALPVVFKWQERDEGGVRLLVASKRKRKLDGEGWCPPRRVEVVRTRRGGAFPSSSRQKENENTTGRAGTLPVVFKWQERNEEGHTPPRCVKKDRNTTGRAPALPVVLSSKNATRRGIPLLVASKRIGEHDGEGTSPPRRVEVVRTRRGGAYPLLVASKGK